MVPKDVEREIGWELPRSLETKFKGKPVLIARSVERLGEMIRQSLTILR